MRMWKAPPTLGSISASGAKNDSIPALLFHSSQTASTGAATITSRSIERAAPMARGAMGREEDKDCEPEGRSENAVHRSRLLANVCHGIGDWL